MKSIEQVTPKAETFNCKRCGHNLPKEYQIKTDGYCYLCDPNITVNELLKDFEEAKVKGGKNVL